ncbi:unnamed protein product [Colias eurytheme]|nr:unnamed protein product [Colias eurytheme]
MKKVEEEVEVDEKISLLENNHENNDEVYKDTRRATVPTVLHENGKEKENSHKISQSHTELQMHQNGHTHADPKKNKTILQKIYDLLDISLLSSPRFLNVILGTALTFISIQNFSMLYPLFLQKVAGMNKQETANCMSAVAFPDIIGRLVLPQAQSKFKISARMTLVLTSIWLLVIRQILAYQTDMFVLLAMSSLYGFGRSMVSVSKNIAISEQCRMDQVASAVGLGMLSMGIIVPPMGYFLGWIRDYTGSYIICITAQNAILVLFLIMWIPDMLHQYYQDKKKNKK